MEVDGGILPALRVKEGRGGRRGKEGRGGEGRGGSQVESE